MGVCERRGGDGPFRPPSLHSGRKERGDEQKKKNQLLWENLMNWKNSLWRGRLTKWASESSLKLLVMSPVFRAFFPAALWTTHSRLFHNRKELTPTKVTYKSPESLWLPPPSWESNFAKWVEKMKRYKTYFRFSSRCKLCSFLLRMSEDKNTLLPPSVKYGLYIWERIRTMPCTLNLSSRAGWPHQFLMSRQDHGACESWSLLI